MDKLEIASKVSSSSLQHLSTAIPLVKDATSMIFAYNSWLQLEGTRRSIKAYQGFIAVLETRALLGYWSWWHYLMKDLSSILQAHLDGGQGLPWLNMLLRAIDRKTAQNFTMKYADVYKISVPAIHDAKFTNIACYETGDERKQLLLRLTLDTLAQWIGLSGSTVRERKLWRIKGEIIDSILSIRQPGIFLLDPVRQACRDVKFVFGNGPHDFNQVQSWLNNAFSSTPENQAESRHLTEQLLGQAPDLQHFLQRNATKLPINSFPISNNLSSQIHSQERMQRVGAACLHFLRETKDTRNCSRSPDWDSMSSLQSYIMSSPDQHSPFRDEAPSRCQFVGTMSSFNFQQASSFFSLLIFRSVLFSSEYVESQLSRTPEDHGKFPFHFPNCKAFIQLRQSHQKNFLFNERAYGQPISQRQLAFNNPDLLWSAAVSWESLCNKLSNRPTFGEADIFFATYKSNLPSFGPLLKLLVLGDLVAADAIQPPSPEEFATFLLDLNLGAAKALGKLGYLAEIKGRDKRLLVNQDRIQAVLRLYGFLREELKKSGELHLMPNIFYFEHLLCKMIRLRRKASRLAIFFRELKGGRQM